MPFQSKRCIDHGQVKVREMDFVLNYCIFVQVTNGEGEGQQMRISPASINRRVYENRPV